MRKRIYWDLDFTMYDTQILINLVRADMVALGSALADVDRIKDELSTIGYTFEEHLRRLHYPEETIAQKANDYRRLQSNGNQFLYPDIVTNVHRFSAMGECCLLTFGKPDYQRHKFEGIELLRQHFSVAHYVWETTKGEVVRANRLESVEDWVIDDSIEQLEDIRQKAPWAKLIRMHRPQTGAAPHPQDGTFWRVARDMDTALHILEET